MQCRSFELRFGLKKKFILKALLIKCIGISFQSWEFRSHNFLTQEHCKLDVLPDMSTFFKPPFWKSLQIVFCLIFTLLEFHRNSLRVRCKGFAKNTHFDKATVLKIIILPSRVRFLCRLILKTFSLPIIGFLKFCSSSLFLLYEKKIPSILLHL